MHLKVALLQVVDWQCPSFTLSHLHLNHTFAHISKMWATNHGVRHETKCASTQHQSRSPLILLDI